MLLALIFLPLALILACVAGTLLKETGGWAMVKAVNRDAGNVLTAAVAGMALLLAYREYRIRNTPTFYCGFDLTDIDPNPAAIVFSVKNTFVGMIQMRFSDLYIDDDSITLADALNLPNVSNEVMRPEGTTRISSLAIPRNIGKEPRHIRFNLTCSSTSGPTHRSTLKCGVKISRVQPLNGGVRISAEWDVYDFSAGLW